MKNWAEKNPRSSAWHDIPGGNKKILSTTHRLGENNLSMSITAYKDSTKRSFVKSLKRDLIVELFTF